jgi:hypothetical protein
MSARNPGKFAVEGARGRPCRKKKASGTAASLSPSSPILSSPKNRRVADPNPDRDIPTPPRVPKVASGIEAMPASRVVRAS